MVFPAGEISRLAPCVSRHPCYLCFACLSSAGVAQCRRKAKRRFVDLAPKVAPCLGIELPFDSSCVTYVWFDALVNYISFAGYLQDDAAFRQRWPALHVIGKDILIPAHGIYWLAMLKAMGFADDDMPTFLVHGYVLVDGDKISKFSATSVTQTHSRTTLAWRGFAIISCATASSARIWILPTNINSALQ